MLVDSNVIFENKWYNFIDIRRGESMYRIGSSSDIHRLAKGRKLTLGGIHIESEVGMIAHSDGDVLIHAIVEAILGALGLGDLGTHFSDKDPRYQGIDSTHFIEVALALLQQSHYEIVNIDTLIILEKIRLEPYKENIRNNLAQHLHIAPKDINIKAATNEQIDALGKGEAILANAVVLLRKKDEFHE